MAAAREMVPEPEAEAAGPLSEETQLSLESLPGVAAKTVSLLKSHGFEAVTDIANAAVEELIRVPGVGQKKAERLIESAKKLIEQRQDA